MTTVKIGFILCSNSRDPAPSTRIAALNMFPFLIRAGFDPHIVFEPEIDTRRPILEGLARRIQDERFQVIVFQKVHGQSVEALARQISGLGIKTVYLVCDIVDASMAEATHRTIAITQYLKSLYPAHLQDRIFVVHDGIERPDEHKTSWSNRRGSRRRPLRAVLVTSLRLECLPVLRRPPRWLEVSILGRYAPQRGIQRLKEVWWTLSDQGLGDRFQYARFLADRRIRRLAWTPARVYEVLKESDIGIIPIDTNNSLADEGGPLHWKVKSESRLTLIMSAGLPVVATPIPSYEPVITHGQNGLFARSLPDWKSQLESLRDPVYRRTLGEQARASVVEKYSMREQGRLLVAVFHSLLSGQD